jgi:sRNA-binding protein
MPRWRHLDVLAGGTERLQRRGGVCMRGHVRHAQRQLIEGGALYAQRANAIRTLRRAQRRVAVYRLVLVRRSQHVL